MNDAWVLILAFLLDLAIGDPRWLPHPVRLMGSAISRIEALFRSFARTTSAELAAGAALAVIMVGGSYGLALLIVDVARTPATGLGSAAGTAVLVFLTATTIAGRELVGSGRLVIDLIKRNDLAGARRNLGMVVGRDTAILSEEQVLKATIETLAENLSDGVIAPLFYYAIGGLPAAMAYKAVNTMDSMVGYRNARYLYFGRVAARLDDLANYLPARISGLLIVLTAAAVSRSLAVFFNAFRIMFRDGGNHLSPNSGVPEAAMAGGLGVRLGGPSTYAGVIVEKPYIGDHLPADYLEASERAMSVVRLSSFFGCIAAAAAVPFVRVM